MNLFPYLSKPLSNYKPWGISHINFVPYNDAVKDAVDILEQVKTKVPTLQVLLIIMMVKAIFFKFKMKVLPYRN